MSDVIHHARPTASQFGAASHRTRFLATIEARAEAFKAGPIIVRAPSPVTFEELAFGPVVCATRDKAPSIREIQAAVCRHYGLSLVEMMSDRRTHAVVFPRHVAIWLGRKLTTNSLPALGRHFGGRDHSTCLHAIQKIEDRRNADAEFNETLNAFIAVLSF